MDNKRSQLKAAIAAYGDQTEELLEDIHNLINCIEDICPNNEYEWVGCFLPKEVDLDAVFNFAHNSIKKRNCHLQKELN